MVAYQFMVMAIGSTAKGDIVVEGIWNVGLSILPVIVLSFLGLLVIKKSGRLAIWLLKSAKIKEEEKIDGISFIGLLPGLISLMGLYFILMHFPRMIITVGKWFALEAQSTSMTSLGGSDQFTRSYRADLLHNAAVVITALFVFLRADLLARLIERTRKKVQQDDLGNADKPQS